MNKAISIICCSFLLSVTLYANEDKQPQKTESEFIERVFELDTTFKEELSKQVQALCGQDSISAYKKEVLKVNEINEELNSELEKTKKELSKANEINETLFNKYKELLEKQKETLNQNPALKDKITTKKQGTGFFESEDIEVISVNSFKTGNETKYNVTLNVFDKEISTTEKTFTVNNIRFTIEKVNKTYLKLSFKRNGEKETREFNF